MGIGAERLRLRPHDPDELSHYSKQTTDIEYAFPMGWSELEGVADRTDYDLSAHSAGSGKSLTIFDEASGEHITPYVIEPAMGVDRAVLTVLLDAYEEQQLAKEKRVVLHLLPSLAPVKVAVMPLLRNRPELVERARALAAELKPRMAAMYDDTASIGKLYRRQDEIGTPYCVTVDVETLEDGAATIRERDSMTQERVAIDCDPRAARGAHGRERRPGRASPARRRGPMDSDRATFERVARDGRRPVPARRGQGDGRLVRGRRAAALAGGGADRRARRPSAAAFADFAEAVRDDLIRAGTRFRRGRAAAGRRRSAPSSRPGAFAPVASSSGSMGASRMSGGPARSRAGGSCDAMTSRYAPTEIEP